MTERDKRPLDENAPPLPAADSDDSTVQIMPLAYDGDSGEQVRHPSLPARITPRRQAFILRGGLAVTLALLIIIVLASNVLSIGELTREALSRLFPAPSPTLPPLPDSNLYYLDLNVPHEQVSLDGRALRYIPRLGVDAPLKLAPGRHVVAWSVYPFRSQSCTISAPYAFGDTCTFAPYQMKVPRSSLAAQVLQLDESLVTLPTTLQQSLQTAVETTINGFHSSSTVQPGETYLTATSYPENIARQPLVATLRFSYDADASGDLVIDGIPCQQLCIVPWSFPATSPVLLPQNPGTWLSVAMVDITWNYTTTDGRIIALKQPLDLAKVGSGPVPILLRITRAETSWQLTPLIGARQVPPLLIYGGLNNKVVSPLDAVPMFDDPACAAAQDLFPGESSLARFISGPTMADGCLVAFPILTHAPIGYYLEHFGILLAANVAARIAYPSLSLANAYDRALARQLLAKQSSQFAG